MNSIYAAMVTLGIQATSTYPDCRGLVISYNETVHPNDSKATEAIASLVSAGKVVLYTPDGADTPRMAALVLMLNRG